MVWETQKIFEETGLEVSCTAVRTPTLRAHAEAITIETIDRINVENARDLLSSAPGVRVVDDCSQNKYPMPLTASERDDVEVGRIRQSLVFGKHGLDLFVCGDQLLRGAALNAVLIAEAMLKGEEKCAPPRYEKRSRLRYRIGASFDERMIWCSLGTAMVTAGLFTVGKMFLQRA